jgi:hypothetical protein
VVVPRSAGSFCAEESVFTLRVRDVLVGCCPARCPVPQKLMVALSGWTVPRITLSSAGDPAGTGG